ncbi:MAG TPA: hypothetical protein VF530_02965 [Planctomycetota bacterium]
MPELETQFGVRCGPLTIKVDLSDPGESRGGSTSSSGITLFHRALAWLPGVLAHELAHWLLHWRKGSWNTLPIVIEEGLAMVAFHRFSATDPPSASLGDCDIAGVLRLTHEEYNKHPDVRSVTSCGVAIAQDLGLERLRELCRRAHQDGLETLPVDWVLEALASAETKGLNGE